MMEASDVLIGDNYELYNQEKLVRLVRKEPQAQRLLEDLLKNWGATWRN
jgi:hypothetical protein